MEEKTMMIAAHYLIELIKCALHGQTIDHGPDGCQYEDIWRLAENNGVEAISYMGFAPEFEPKTIKKWKESVNVTLFRQISFDGEREQILEKLEEAEVCYMPLKGILIQDYYRRPGMRSMADNDILYGGPDLSEEQILETQKKVIQIMQDLGYEIESLKGNHDAFLKEPCFNFELHRHLMDYNNSMRPYYDGVWDRAVVEKENPYHYQMTDEDEYIYFMAHAFKHFDLAGCGIRPLIDLYVMLEKKQDMDWKYIANELQTHGMTAFEQQLKKLSMHCFSEGELDEADEKLLLFMLGCGTYGNLDVKVDQSLKKLSEDGNVHTKAKYFKQRLFLSPELCRSYFPFFYKHRWLIWLLPFYRLGRGLVRHPAVLWREFRKVCRSNK